MFDEIYRTYWSKVFRLCMGYVNDYEWAQDIAQETFIIVWQQLPRFRNESNVGTWIYRIATNNCLRQIDREKRKSTDALPENIPEVLVPDLEPQIQLLYKFVAE